MIIITFMNRTVLDANRKTFSATPSSASITSASTSNTITSDSSSNSHSYSSDEKTDPIVEAVTNNVVTVAVSLVHEAINQALVAVGGEEESILCSTPSSAIPPATATTTTNTPPTPPSTRDITTTPHLISARIREGSPEYAVQVILL